MDIARVVVGLIFIVTIFLIVKRPTIPSKVPLVGGIKIDYWLASLIGAFFMLIFHFFYSKDAWTLLNILNLSIIGTREYQPIGVVILFISLAFIAFTLDTTGFFEYWALKALRFAKGSEKRLFLYYYILISCLTILTSNDIIILTMTPFIYYTVINARLNPIPFLIAEFFAANTWSMTLLIGNPTNIIVAESFRLEFIDYFRWMALPALAGGLVNLLILFGIFREDIKNRYSLELIQKPVCKDPLGARIGFLLLSACLLALAILSGTVHLWIVSSLFAILYIIFLLFTRSPKKEEKDKNFNAQKSNEVITDLKRVIIIAPFVLSLFIIVEVLKIHGIIDILASFLFYVISNHLAWGVFVIGFGSVFACNLVNNIPMTITFVKILQTPLFMGMQNVEGWRYALCMGSNLGANITPIGALAGIMWLSVLQSKGLKEVNEKEIIKKFIKYGLITTISTTVFSSLVLTAEVCAGW